MGGYAGAIEQEATRRALEAAGGREAEDFWLGFDIQGPDVLPGFQRSVIPSPRRTRNRSGAQAQHTEAMQHNSQASVRPRPPLRDQAPLVRAEQPHPSLQLPTLPPPPPPPSPPSPPPDQNQNPRDAEQLLELSRSDHRMWAFLRRAPIAHFLLRPPLLPKKHFTNKQLWRRWSGDEGGIGSVLRA